MLCSLTTGNSGLPVYTAGLHPNLHKPSVATALLMWTQVERGPLESASDRLREALLLSTSCQLSFAKIWLTCHLSIAVTSQNSPLSNCLLYLLSVIIDLTVMSAITDHSVLAPDSWQASLKHNAKLLYQECCHMFPFQYSLNFISSNYIIFQNTSLRRSAQVGGSSWLQRSQAWFCQVKLTMWRQRLLACTRFWVAQILGDMFGCMVVIWFSVYHSHIWGQWGRIVWLCKQVCGRCFWRSRGHGVSFHTACVSMGRSIPMASQLHYYLIFK